MLAGGEYAELYLRIDHHAGSLYMPTSVTTAEDFLAWEVNYVFLNIAERLSLAEFTVSTHRRNIMHKLELSNVAALVQLANDYGL